MGDDEFDREAEREKLREKYEEDRADRAATERMSELLLQGATMTDRHCETCGDPIFQHDGQAFCPTCQAEVDGQAAESEPDTSATSGDGGDPGTADADASDGVAGVEPESDATSTAAGGRSTDPDATPPPSGGGTRASDPEAGTNPGTAGSRPDPQRLARDADDPRTALADAVTTLARDAATTDDPRRARDMLAAAREAAEALAALDG